MPVAINDIKHNGKWTLAGEELNRKDFSDEAWASLVEAGAVESETFQESPPEPTPEPVTPPKEVVSPVAKTEPPKSAAAGPKEGGV
jgi:hypothetical protein